MPHSGGSTGSSLSDSVGRPEVVLLAELEALLLLHESSLEHEQMDDGAVGCGQLGALRLTLSNALVTL